MAKTEKPILRNIANYYATHRLVSNRWCFRKFLACVNIPADEGDDAAIAPDADSESRLPDTDCSRRDCSVTSTQDPLLRGHEYSWPTMSA